MHKTTLSILLGIGVFSLSGCSGSNHIAPAAEHATLTSDTDTADTNAAEAALAATGILSQSSDGGTGGNSAAPAAASSPAAGPLGRAAVGEDLPRMIYVRDTCMIDAGRSAILTCGTADGSMTSLVASDEVPGSNGQANFDCLGAPYISLADGAAAVLTGDRYQLFLAEDVVEYNGIYKNKNDVSEDTLKWLDFYYSLAEQDRNALSMVPREFSGELVAVMETAGSEDSYMDALTEAELLETEALAQSYFTYDTPIFEGVDQIYPVTNDLTLYHNSGLEGEYAPGNIIIYKVLTVKDRRDGNPFRFISIARNSKSDDWKVINCGY